MLNKAGLTAMQDAILFILMVSISGAILMPAFTNPTIMKGYMEREKDELVDEALLVLLATTKNEFSYILADETIKEALGGLGENEFGRGILYWLVGRTEYHKTYSQLIAECLSCQFMIPVGEEKFKCNFLVSGFESSLKENISQQLKIILGDKYSFNFTAIWNPILGIPFGGKISVGEPPPSSNVYVARTWITIPYIVEVGAEENKIILTTSQLRKLIENNVFYKNTIGLLDKLPKNEEGWEKLRNDLTENITDLLFSLIFDGTNDMKGLLHLCLDVLFEEIKNYVKGIVSEFTESVGKPVMTIIDELLRAIVNKILEKIDIEMEANENVDEEYVEKLIDGLVNYFRKGIIEGTISLLQPVKGYFEKLIEKFVDYIIDLIKQGADGIEEQIFDWTINRISITKAEVRLALWEV